MNNEYLHATDCQCQECLDKWESLKIIDTPISEKCLPIHSIDGFDTFRVMFDVETIDICSSWIDAKKEPPRKDIPILIVTKFSEMPDVVIWVEEGTYGEPGFFDSNEEYDAKEENILYWMPAPKIPNN